MKILVINPVGHTKWDESDRRFFKSIASPDTEVEVVSLASGPPSVETINDYEIVKPLVVEKALESHRGYDGLIVNCFLDPGVDELKKSLHKPVVGPGESSLAFASVFGGKIGIVSIESEALNLINQRCRELGYSERISTIRGIKIHVVDLEKNWDITRRELINESMKAVKEGSDVIILGCTGLAGLAGEVSEAIGRPVIDPAAAALKMVESLISLKLRKW